MLHSKNRCREAILVTFGDTCPCHPRAREAVAEAERQAAEAAAAREAIEAEYIRRCERCKQLNKSDASLMQHLALMKDIKAKLSEDEEVRE